MRRKEREVTDKEEIRQILEKGQVIRIAMNNGEYPYILPVNYGYEMENGRITLFSTEQRKEPSMKSWKRMHMYR